MDRPTRWPRPSEADLSRNLVLDLTAAVGVGATTALVASLLPSIARRGGLDPLGLAALAAAPFVANLLGAFAGQVGPRSVAELAVVRAAGAGLLLLLVVTPAPPVLILVAVGFWMSLSFGGPFHLRLWGAMYPGRLRGRIVGAIGTSRSAAAGLAVVSAGIVADRLGGDAVVAAAGIVGLVCAVAYAAFHVPPIGPAPRFSARESVRTLRTRPALSRIVLAQGFYGGGFIAAAPLFALVYVDRLGLSLAEVGLVGILTAAATTFSFYAWGAVADRLGPTAVLRAGSAIGLAGLVAYATAPGVVVLFLGAVAIGAANASIDTGIASAVSNETSLETRSAAMAGWNALTGMRGIAAPFAISGLVQLGVLDVSSGLLWCGIICSIGVALYARAHSLRYEPAKPATARAPTGALEPA